MVKERREKRKEKRREKKEKRKKFPTLNELANETPKKGAENSFELNTTILPHIHS